MSFLSGAALAGYDRVGISEASNQTGWANKNSSKFPLFILDTIRKSKDEHQDWRVPTTKSATAVIPFSVIPFFLAVIPFSVIHFFSCNTF